MVDAVSAVISSTPFLRRPAEGPEVQQQSVATSPSPSNAPQAPFISPFIAVNNDFDTAVIQIRDSDTGDVVRQFPSESTLRARQSADEVVAQANRELFSDVQVENGEDSSVGETGGEGFSVSVDLGRAQQAAAALSTAAAAQTSEIAQSVVSFTA